MNGATLLYVSELTPEAPASVVGAITKASRLNNERDGICGLLVFDGARFAQLVEGPKGGIEALLERLQGDTRHTHLHVLALEEMAGIPRFPSWHLGLLITDAEESNISALASLQGTDAIDGFCALMPQLDMGEGLEPALATNPRSPSAGQQPIAKRTTRTRCRSTDP